MSKIGIIQDDTNGVVIGEFSTRVGIKMPSGKIEYKTYIRRSVNPIEWAAKIINEIKNEKLGNGLPISNYPDIFKSIYGDGEFSVVIFD